MSTRTSSRIRSRVSRFLGAAVVAVTALTACGGGGGGGGAGGDGAKASGTTAPGSTGAVSMNSFCPSAAETQQRLQLRLPVDVQSLSVTDFQNNRATCQYARPAMKKDSGPAKIFHIAVDRNPDVNSAHRNFTFGSSSNAKPLAGVGDEAETKDVGTRLRFRRGIYIVTIEEDLNIYSSLVDAQNFTSFARDVLVPRLPAGPALSAAAAADSPNPVAGTVAKGAADRVSKQDGPIVGDGVADVVFNVTLNGQVIDLALYRCQPGSGSPVAQSTQWDTFAGTRPVDAGTAFSGSPGSATPQLGVFKADGTKLNDTTGGLKDQYFSAPTPIQLVVADTGTITGGNSFCIRQYRAGGGPVTAIFAPVS
jgi:hypothetical protein